MHAEYTNNIIDPPDPRCLIQNLGLTTYKHTYMHTYIILSLKLKQKHS